MDEATATAQLLALFEQVQARQPYKGVKALLARAKRLPMPYSDALKQTVADATQRTQRRLALLSTCGLDSRHRTEP